MVCQFGATNSDDLVEAAGHVVKVCDGIDINSGCPQKWAIKEGFGCALLDNPELLRDMVVRLKNAYPIGHLEHEVTISVKIRIFSDLKRTIAFTEQMARTGIDFMTVHARTVNERSGDRPHYDTTKAINDLALRPAQVPMVFNGAILTMDEASNVAKYVL